MSAKRFRTRPVEIEAMQYTGFESHMDLVEWTEGNFRKRPQGERIVELATMPVDENTTLSQIASVQVYDKLHTTWINVLEGQWIVRGAKGEYYPCDDETFHWKYEEVVDADYANGHTYDRT